MKTISEMTTAVILCLSLTLTAACASASTWYVDQNVQAPNPDGSAALPFTAVQQAIDVAGPGDTILVRRGIYRESVYFKKSGSDGRPITLAGYPGEQVVLSGSDVLTTFEPLTDKQRNIWVVKNLPLPPGQVFLNGTPLQQIGPDPMYSRIQLAKLVEMQHPIGKNRDDLFPGSFHYDATEKTLYFWPASNLPCYVTRAESELPRVEAAVRGPVVWSDPDVSHLHLTNLTIRHGLCASRMWSIVQLRGNNITVENCVIEQADFGGLGGYGSRWIVRNNIIRDNGATGIGANHLHNALIENNDIHGNDWRNIEMFHHAGGIKLTETHNARIAGNRIHDNNATGLWFDIDCPNALIENNDIRNNAGEGVFVEISRSALVRNNRIVDNGLRGIYIASSDDCVVEYNHLTNDSILLHGMPRKTNDTVRTLKNNIVRYNVIDTPAGPLMNVAPPDDSTIAGNVLQSNLYITTPGKGYWYFGHNRRITDPAQWRELTGDTSTIASPDDRVEANLASPPDWNFDALKQSLEKPRENKPKVP